MAYLGQGAEGNFTTTNAKDTFSGDGSETSFTLSQRGTENNVDVFVNNVRQEPGVAYNIEGNGTSLVFTAAPSTGTNNIYVVNRGPAELSASHPASQNLEAADGTFTGDLTVDTNTLKVDSTNNRVGIGTTSPSAPLEVNVSGQGDALILTRDTGTNGELQIDFNGANANHNSVQGGHTFATNGTERMRITSSGLVGIGTTLPAHIIDTQGAASGDIVHRIKNSTTGTSARAGLYVDADDGNKGNFLATSSAYTGVGSWQDATVLNASSLASGGLILNAQGGDIKFQRALTEKARITSSGLTFNGDTAAANALDDYEEGTFTLTLDGVDNTGLTVYSAQYVKVGNMVTVSFYIVFPAVTDNSSISIQLPFQAVSLSNGWQAGTIGYNTSGNEDQGTIINNGTNDLQIRNKANGSQRNYTSYSGNAIIASITYRTA